MDDLSIERASQTGQEAASNPLLNLVVLYRAGESEGISYSVNVKSLTTNGIILETINIAAGINPESLKGKESLIMIPSSSPAGLARVGSKILWARLREEDQPDLVMGLEFKDPLSLPLRQALESHLPISAKDMKGLWDQWDQVHGIQLDGKTELEAVVPDQSTPLAPRPSPAEEPHPGWGSYYVGLGVITAGAALQFTDADYLNFSGFILVIYGSFVIAVKSLYHLWRTRSQPERK
jgi:hypothetical protein